MNDIPPIGQSSQAALARIAARRAAAAQEASGAAPPADSVELSQTAQLLAKLAELPDVRQDLIDRIRAEIAAGTYETSEKLDAALEALIEDLEDTE